MGHHHPKTVVVVPVVGMVPVPRPAAFGASNRRRRLDGPACSVRHREIVGKEPCLFRLRRSARFAIAMARRRTGLRLAPATKQATDLVDQPNDVLVLSDRQQGQGEALAQQQAQRRSCRGRSGARTAARSRGRWRGARCDPRRARPRSAGASTRGPRSCGRRQADRSRPAAAPGVGAA